MAFLYYYLEMILLLVDEGVDIGVPLEALVSHDEHFQPGQRLAIGVVQRVPCRLLETVKANRTLAGRQNSVLELIVVVIIN
jgi:hypothetical protein